MSFSRPFIHTGSQNDTWTSLNQTPADTVCKTTFRFAKVDGLLDSNPTAHYIKIVTGVQMPGGARIFIMQAFDSADGFLQAVEGDFPCPDNCVPPEKIDLIGPDNTFDIQDIRDVLNFPQCSHLNVHSSVRRDSTNPMATHSIYALTGSFSNATDHKSPGDPVFTSIVNK